MNEKNELLDKGEPLTKEELDKLLSDEEVEVEVETHAQWSEFFIRTQQPMDEYDIEWHISNYVFEEELGNKVCEAFFVIHPQVNEKPDLSAFLENFVERFGEATLIGEFDAKFGTHDQTLGFYPSEMSKEERKIFNKKAKFICDMFEDIYAEEIKEIKQGLKNDVISAKQEIRRDKGF